MILPSIVARIGLWSNGQYLGDAVRFGRQDKVSASLTIAGIRCYKIIADREGLMILAVIFILLIFLYSIFSRMVGRSVITAPIVFTAAVYWFPSFLRSHGRSRRTSRPSFSSLSGLVLLLFTDSSRIKLRDIRTLRRLPARLLSVGMLLTILLGAIAAILVFPGLSIWEAGVLAAILAPTDAGLDRRS